MDYSTHKIKKSLHEIAIVEYDEKMSAPSQDSFPTRDFARKELDELLSLAPPVAWKQMLESIYFGFLIGGGYDTLPEPTSTTEKVYALMKFFEEMEAPSAGNQ